MVGLVVGPVVGLVEENQEVHLAVDRLARLGVDQLEEVVQSALVKQQRPRASVEAPSQPFHPARFLVAAQQVVDHAMKYMDRGLSYLNMLEFCLTFLNLDNMVVDTLVLQQQALLVAASLSIFGQ